MAEGGRLPKKQLFCSLQQPTMGTTDDLAVDGMPDSPKDDEKA